MRKKGALEGSMCALALAFVDFCTTNQGSNSYFVYVLATGDVTSQFYIIYILNYPGFIWYPRVSMA